MSQSDGGLRLRPATLQDAGLLLAWRNDPDTRRASHQNDVIPMATHMAWLARALEDPCRRLCMAEAHGVPVGTVRADFSHGAHVLSWTVAPEARGRGLASRMVAMFAHGLREPLRAEIRVGNLASVRVAEHAGLVFEREADGVLSFSRPALP